MKKMIQNGKKGLFKDLFIVSFIIQYHFFDFIDHYPYRLYRGSINFFLISVPNDKGHFLISAEAWSWQVLKLIISDLVYPRSFILLAANSTPSALDATLNKLEFGHMIQHQLFNLYDFLYIFCPSRIFSFAPSLAANIHKQYNNNNKIYFLLSKRTFMNEKWVEININVNISVV